MNWFETLFCEHSAMQNLAVLSVIMAMEPASGNLCFKGDNSSAYSAPLYSLNLKK